MISAVMVLLVMTYSADDRINQKYCYQSDQRIENAGFKNVF